MMCPDGYSAAGFFYLQKLEVFFSFERCSTVRPCADKCCMQTRMLAFTPAYNAYQHTVLCTYTFQKAFFLL